MEQNKAFCFSRFYSQLNMSFLRFIYRAQANINSELKKNNAVDKRIIFTIRKHEIVGIGKKSKLFYINNIV